MSLEPASGISSITGYAGGPPIRSGLSFTDPYSGFIAAGAILTALNYRRRTVKGQYIDLSEQEAGIPSRSEDEFGRLAAAIGHPDCTSDARFASAAARRQHHDELDAAITAWT